MDKFLFYAKFAALIIVAVLFVIAYSFSYRDFPVSTAQYQLASQPSSSENSNNPCTIMRILVLSDYQSIYKSGVSKAFNLIEPLKDNICNLDFDLVLLENTTMESDVLSNISGGLSVRLYQDKDYDYIIALGKNAAAPAQEIRQMFFPDAQLLLYGTSGEQISNTLSSSYSISGNVENTIKLSAKLNPLAATLLFLCDESDYSHVITNIAHNYVQKHNNVSINIIYSSEKNIDEAADYIISHSDYLSVFYVSFKNDDGNSLHSSIINYIQNNTGEIIYDLSPFAKESSDRYSLKYWSEGLSSEPSGYLAILPDELSAVNYEFIDFLVLNMSLYYEGGTGTQFNDSSSFIGWCLQNMGIPGFPETLEEQFSFCSDNSMLIEKNDLKPGDLIFVTTEKGLLPDSISGLAVYINETTVIAANKYGELCFTKIMTDEYQAAYASPFSILDD